MKQTRRAVLKGMTAAALAAALPQTRAATGSNTVNISKLDKLLAESIIIDDLCEFRPNVNTGEDEFRIASNSSITIAAPTIGSVVAAESYQSSLTRLAQLNAGINRHSDRVLLINKFTDIEKAKQESRIGILPAFQNSTAIGTDLSRLDLFYGLGVRQIQLTHNLRNWVGDGCTERTQAGLTHFGVDLVRKMNELGIIVDVGHSGYQTTLDAIEISSKPIVFSHTNCMALCKHPRNKTDEQIKALAAKGGVMGISNFNWFVSDNPKSTLDDLLDHFDYVINLVGPDHVGIGSDFELTGYPGIDGDKMWIDHLRIYSEQERRTLKVRWPPFIKAVDNEWRYKTIARGLLSRGHSEEVVVKILGLNFQRVFREILVA
ncbi:MAG: membrane dipeptidase [Gammaproteobacteria bacterium]|jgi:membrane dipeptidase|nr:membrane dipeptidase [Gammaproteobacteria bacterium]